MDSMLATGARLLHTFLTVSSKETPNLHELARESGREVSARWLHLSRWLAYSAGLLLLAGPLLGDDHRSSLLMTEGQVISVAEKPGEGALAIVTVQLVAPADDAPSWELLLAPRSALAEIGFEVELGDQVKARIFPSAEGPAKVHKVLNVTRRKMVRLRTLTQIPLWDSSGAWQGGECRELPMINRQSRDAQPDQRY
jgi:hypothetical protein